MHVRGSRCPQRFDEALHSEDGEKHPKGTSEDSLARKEVMLPSMELLD